MLDDGIGDNSSELSTMFNNPSAEGLITAVKTSTTRT